MVNLKLPTTITALLCLMLSLITPNQAHAQNFPASDFDPNRRQVSAFPGAEGFGKYATGGRGGQVLKVTNLNDSGPGSLRAAIETRGPRIVVFEVSGTIDLQSDLVVRDGSLTVAGQTAPGDGITLRRHGLKLMNIDNVVIRYLRSRPGDIAKKEVMSIFAVYLRNSIIDHCTFSWSTDEASTLYKISDVTLQWSIISEALHRSVHSKGAHGFAAITGGKNVSWHHNLFAHADQRMTMFDHPGLYAGSQENQEWRGTVDFRNNVIYNWLSRATNNGEGGRFNVVNNYYKPGPATPSGEARSFFLHPTSSIGETQPNYGKFFLNGNILEGNVNVNGNNWVGVKLENSELTQQYLTTTKLSAELPTVIYDLKNNAQESYIKVLDYAGASLVRDPVDTRVSSEVRNGTFTFSGSKGSRFGVIDSQNDVGGWPTLRSLPAPVDTDQDGMPDTWEVANGLNPNRSNDSEYNLSPYYTDIEVYINSLVDGLVKNQYPNTPLTVVPLLPVANANNVAPIDISFAWEMVPNADVYQVQISKSSTFASGNITLSNLRNLSIVYPQLDANSTYFWRVRAARNGVFGAYSTTRSFQTNALTAVPGQTILLSPKASEDSVDLEPEMVWAKVPNALTYDLQISTTTNFSSPVFSQTGILPTSFKVPKLLENQSYFWRVRARNASGVGVYSAIGTFRTASLNTRTPAVVPIRPTNGVTINPVNIRLEWIPVPGAESYRVQVSTNSSFSSNVVFREGLTTPFLDIPNLNSNTVYYWRVIGFNEAGLGIVPRSPYMFNTGPFTEAPAQISLGNPLHDSNLFSTSISFSWIASPIAKSYTFQLSTREDFGTFVQNVSGLTTTSRAVSNLQANTQYYWRVWASNEAGNSPASEVRKVRSATYSGTPAATVLLSPSNNAAVGATDILFAWQNQPNTEFYRLEISESTSFGSLVFSRSSIRGTSWLVPSLSINKTYYWRVRTSNPAGTGSYSSVWKFSTNGGTVSLSQPILVSPTNASLNMQTSLSLNWNQVANATSYDVQLSESNTFATIAFSQTGITSNNANFGSLLESKTYFWRVRAKAGTVVSNWSDTWNFGTKGKTENSTLTAGLVGHWSMEEGNGNRILDISGRSNHGTLQSTANVAWVEGKVGLALSLNGLSNRYALIPHSQSLEIPSAVTISAWVRPNTLHRGTILSKSSGNGFEFWLDINGQLEFRLNRSSNGSSYVLRSNFNYGNSLQTWIHLAATFDGSTMRIYVNGNEDNSRSFNPFGIGTTSGNLVLGALATTQRMNGAMDEVMLHNRALSLEEIRQAMQGGPGIQTNSPQLVGHWKMDEGSGNVFRDESGNANNATIVNTSGITWSEAKIGLGVNLNGFSDRFGRVPYNASLEINDALTIAAWVKPNVLNRGTVISKSAGNGFELWLDIDGFVEFRLNRTNNGSTYRLRSNYNYSGDIGKWIHVAATFDGQTSKIFINGIENVSQTYATPFAIGTTSGDLVIGAMGTIQRMNGSMDDVRLYAQSLSASQVAGLVADGNVAMRSILPTRDHFEEQAQFQTQTSDHAIKLESGPELSQKPVLYPNPVEHTIYVSSLWIDEGSVAVNILDLSGRSLHQRQVAVNNKNLELELKNLHLMPGNYLLVIQDYQKRVVLKFIKQ